MRGWRNARETVTALTPASLATSAKVLRFLRMTPLRRASEKGTYWVRSVGLVNSRRKRCHCQLTALSFLPNHGPAWRERQEAGAKSIIRPGLKQRRTFFREEFGCLRRPRFGGR